MHTRTDWRVILFRNAGQWFIYRGHYATEKEAHGHGKQILKWQPSWDYQVVRAEAAIGICALLNG